MRNSKEDRDENQSSRENRVLAYFIQRGPDGAIRHQATSDLDILLQSMCWIVARLRKKKLLVQTNRFRDTEHGKPAHVLVATRYATAANGEVQT